MKPTAVVVAALLACCSRADVPAANQARPVPAFHAIDLAGTLDVEATAGKPPSVQVFTDAGQLDHVTTAVKDGVLVIDTTHEFSSNSRTRVVVTAPDLTSLVMTGTGRLSASGIANQALVLGLRGTGELIVAGTTGALRATGAGTGEIDAKALVANDVTVALAGTGDVTVHASQSVDATLTGTGSIHIEGHPPKVVKSATGVGEIELR